MSGVGIEFVVKKKFTYISGYTQLHNRAGVSQEKKMKIYLVLDLNGDFTQIFTTKKAAEKYYKNDKKKAPLKPPEKFEIPISKEGMLRAIDLGANWGGGEVGFGG